LKVYIIQKSKSKSRKKIFRQENLTWWTRATVGARKTQALFWGCLIKWPISYISRTAMWVLPQPVPKYTIIFSSRAFLHNSNWYLKVPKTKIQEEKKGKLAAFATENANPPLYRDSKGLANKVYIRSSNHRMGFSQLTFQFLLSSLFILFFKRKKKKSTLSVVTSLTHTINIILIQRNHLVSNKSQIR
jgi:hypothetical protein